MDVITAPAKSALILESHLVVLLVREGEIDAFRKSTAQTKSKSSGRKAESFLTELDVSSNHTLSNALRHDKFQGKSGQSFFSYVAPASGMKASMRAVLLVGSPAETKDRFQRLQTHRKLGGGLYDAASRCRAATVAIVCGAGWLADAEAAEALLEGLTLANYRFERYKSKKTEQPYDGPTTVTLHGGKLRKGLTDEVATLAAATKAARDLVNTPARDCTPSHIVEAARAVARAGKLKLDVLDKQKLVKLGANCILAVAQGSEEPPYLLKLTYTPKGKAKKRIALVGKGVTFDTGGYSLKPAGGMESMKVDMSGAAAVIYAMQAIAALRPNVEVRAYVPTVENMVNGRATRPGDVVAALNGKTIEILNTDAEGRLILADAIAYAVREKPDMIVDVATLTGACVVALGEEYAGVFTDHQKLLRGIMEAAEQSGERLWHMPLAPEYVGQMKSTVADLKNIGGGGKGGAIFGALFIREFAGDIPWAHLDIAGPATSEGDKEFLKKGGTGFGVRTLTRFVCSQ